MTRDEVRAIVFEVLQELLEGTVKWGTERTPDGEEWNRQVFDGELFVERVFAKLPPSSES